MDTETFRFVLNIFDAWCLRYRVRIQTWHKIVHTVHIILIQYSFLFGIRQALYTLSKIPECAENYVSKQTLRKILIRNTDAKHESTTQNIPIAFSQYKRGR